MLKVIIVKEIKIYPLSVSPVKEISFGDALKISLDNYYDLPKTNIGGLATEEYIQLKQAADIVDLSPNELASKGELFSLGIWV